MKHPLHALGLLAVGLITLLLFPPLALASATPVPSGKLVLPSLQFWSAAVGALAPLASYLINHYVPFIVSEKVKALVHVVVAAAVGVVYPLIATGGWAFDTRHLELVGSAVVAALVAHKIIYLPSGISAALGGGSNAPVVKV